MFLQLALQRRREAEEMWRRGKKRGGEAVAGDEAAPSKKARESDDESDDIVVCELSKNRRVTVRNWQGKAVVDIREFYVKEGKTLPGKKGISLSMDQWKILRDHIKKIDQAVKENE